MTIVKAINERRLSDNRSCNTQHIIVVVILVRPFTSTR